VTLNREHTLLVVDLAGNPVLATVTERVRRYRATGRATPYRCGRPPP
jgi:hypothetical protein